MVWMGSDIRLADVRTGSDSSFKTKEWIMSSGGETGKRYQAFSTRQKLVKLNNL